MSYDCQIFARAGEPNCRAFVVEVKRAMAMRRRLLAVGSVSAVLDAAKTAKETYDLARIFLLLRLRRRTRFFLHLALIFDS